jgi:hypothetical protein
MKHLCLIILLFAVLGLSGSAALISFDNVNRTIPNGLGTGVSDVRTMGPEIGTIASIRILLTITGGFNGDLYCYLRHGDGPISVLLNRPGRTGEGSPGYGDSGFQVAFSDGALNGDIHSYQTIVVPPTGMPLTGIWQPDGRDIDPALVTVGTPQTALLSSFYGANAAGEWTLFIADLQDDDGPASVLQSWGLEITPVPEPVNVALGVFGTVALGVTAFRVYSSRRRRARCQ